MSVEPLLSHSTPPLRLDDSVEFGLGLLMESRLRHLPVVDHEGHLQGVVSEDVLLDSGGPATLVGSLLSGPPVQVGTDAHVFEVTRVMLDHDLTAVPVVDKKGIYQGLLRRHELFERFARMLATQLPGAILAIEVDSRDLALSKLIYLIEQNDVRVLSLAVEPGGLPDGKVGITIKLNMSDVSRIRHLLEHNGYHVVAAFGEEEDAEDLLNRVQEFLRYLEV